ncbi:MAG: L-threonylcarbamoyladenylate synthase [Actinomycetota bacterium]|nr:L-threonylcarbamoyladenylate synthase [Actinomycetota bacterium]
MSYRFDCSEAPGRRRGLARAGDVLDSGELVVLPTEASYGLAADAFSDEGVAALRAAKGNRRLVPPVLIGSCLSLDGLATDVSAAARELAESFWPGPLTLVFHAQPTLDWSLTGPWQAAVSLRVPLHPVALHLLARTGPLAVTGANTPGHPLPATYDEAHEQLGDLVAVYLDAGPATYGGPSTVVDARSDVPRVVRRGALDVATLRGAVPDLLDLKEESA